MSNIKFSQLPNLGNIEAATIVPVVNGLTNFTVTMANLQSYVNSATGNITASYFIGNGSQLTGLPESYGNSNVAAYLPVNSANIQGNFITAIGNISGAYLIGNGSQITGLPANYGNTQVAEFLSNLGSNAVSTTGNVTAAFVVGNISGATGGYGNSNVQSVLQTYSGTFTAGTVSTTGNITGNFFVGNGSQLSGITASLSGNLTGNINGNGFGVGNLSYISATGNITGVHQGNGSQLTGIPTSITAGTGISVSASTGAITITNNNPTPYANANVSAFLPTYSGTITASTISASGNITGTHLGNGGGLANIVTSIAAGPGISINSSTGAVTITNTGAGGIGNSISNGNSNVNIATSGGNITMSVGGSADQLLIRSLTGTFTGIVANCGIEAQTVRVTGNTGSGLVVNGAYQQSAAGGGYGFFSVGGMTSVNLNSLGQTFITSPEMYLDGSGGNIFLRDGNVICTSVGGVSTFTLPTFTITALKATTGIAGRTAAVTDSPTYAGRLAYWSSTVWRYVDDNSLV